MATNFPGSLDNGTTLPNPNTTDKRNSPSLAGQQGNQNDSIKAIETKVGTGSSTPVANSFLFGTGTGTSAWTQITSAQLIASMTDETGTGSAVFANTPTLITPKVDTINESTLNNGVTIGGVNLKSGALNTNNAVVTANITDGAVTGPKLATSAILLGYASISVTQGSITTAVDLTNLAVTVTVPSGGRSIKLVANLTFGCSSALSLNQLDFYEGATLLKRCGFAVANTSNGFNYTFMTKLTPTAGSHTYKLQASAPGGGALSLIYDGTNKILGEFMVEAI